VRFNKPDLVTLLEQNGAVADAKAQLMAAALMNRPTVIGKLLSEGLDVNTKDRDGDIALAYAASWGHIEVVKMLIAHGADVNSRNDRNQNSLYWASTCTDPAKSRIITKILRDAGAR
jgi:ankyrin repeat protein